MAVTLSVTAVTRRASQQHPLIRARSHNAAHVLHEGDITLGAVARSRLVFVIHVFVQNRTAAEAWYARVMGLSRNPDLEFWAADGWPLMLEDSANTVRIAVFERPRLSNRATIALRASAEGFRAWQLHLATFPELEVNFEDHQVAVSLYFSDIDGNPYEITTYEYEPFAAAR